MPTPLLKTKLYVPPIRSELVSRPRLIERLNEGLEQGCKLTLVSAPAGYGKTTLLSSWVADCELHVCAAWVSLDEGNNDPASFWAYVGAAFQTIRAGIGETVQAAFESPHPPPIESVLTGLLNQIAQVPDAVVLVLDDYHAISTPAIHKALTFLLENMPPQMHLVLATRADPPLPVPRLRGRGQLIELYESDLRFTSEEAAEFLRQVVGLRVSTEDVAALKKRTEGWIAGLQMAAISMRARDDVSEFVRAFAGSNRYVLDYLGEEVLRQQPEKVQVFLLHTAILNRLSGELCDTVIGTGEQAEDGLLVDSQSMLEYLERSNLFVVPLDDERRWYRYHHLFADLLRQRLQREKPGQVPELHRRASEWYERDGQVAEAVGHALASGDFGRAAHLVEKAAWPMLTRGGMTTLLGWLAALSDDIVRTRPQLGALGAWALALTGQVDRVEPYLLDVDLEPVQGEVAALRAYVADLGRDLPQAIQFCHHALDLLPEENLFLRSIVTLILGVATYWTGGDPSIASQTLLKAAALGQASGNVQLDVIATCYLGHAQVMQGYLCRAVETFERAFQIATNGDSASTLFVGLGHVGMARVLYEWNDLDGAMRHARQGIELGERGESVDVLLGGYSYLPLAQLHQAQGEWEKALQVLQRAEQFASQCSQSHVQVLVAASRARLWLARGNLVAASSWAQTVQISPTDEPAYEHEFEHTTLSWVLVTQDRPDEALELLTRLHRAAEAKGRTGRMIEILALQALAHQVQSRGEQALSALQRALSVAEPEGYVRTFVDLGGPMARLLRQALSRGIAPNYVARLLAAFGQEAELPSPAMASLVEPLTERELDVLRLVVAGLSNSEIAGELVIAVSTVKSHINRIYGKLGVKNRTQAVIKAQELALL